MPTLDTIIEMQQKGMTDYEISTNLQSQGVSPREINDALNQAKIKSAVTDTAQPGAQTQPASIMSQAQPGAVPQAQPASIMPQAQPQPGTMTQPQEAAVMPQPQNGAVPQAIQPQPVEEFPQPQASIMQEQPQEAYAPQETYPQQEYYEDDYYSDEGGYADTETITEIAEQVIKEKFKDYKRKTGDVSAFIAATQDKMANMDQRLKRIENTIDKLQHAIIQRIGEFGENTNLIKRDLDNLHDTTSKLMNPLIDNYRELQKINEKKHRH
jgi:hypothetical protein